MHTEIELLAKGAFVFLEKRPPLAFGEAKELYDIRVETEYKTLVL